MANTFDSLKDEYATLWQAMTLRPERLPELNYIYGKLTNPASKARYQAVETTTRVPWYVIGIVHDLEASLRFDTHLHNGDPLSGYTYHVPANRPQVGHGPPFSWEESAKDALEYDHLTEVTTRWTVERIAFELEKYNGFGYRNKHPHVKSPYLWSYTNIYTSGKYVGDNAWSESAVSNQAGAMAMLKYMIDKGAIAVEHEGTAPTPDQPPQQGSVPTFPGYYLSAGRENDPNVEIVQRRLRVLGIDTGTIDGDFGPNTEQAVRLFQARSADAAGEPLEIDGIVGPKTWGALFNSPTVQPPPPPTPSALTTTVLEVAGDEVGVREDPLGSNRGPRVDQYIRATGLDPSQDSYPWCMCFVYWCFTQAAQRAHLQNLVPENGSVHSAWEKSQNTLGVTVVPASAASRDPAQVKPGMVFFIDTGHSHGHAGIVVANVNSLLETIEGNTNDNGSSEGIGVFRRTRRRIGDISLGFVGYG